MADPLSVSASIITVLQAVKSLYRFIESIKDTPEVLTRAGDDLKATDSVLEDLSQYLEAFTQPLPTVQALTDQKSALRSVLSQCERLCDDFRKELDKCVSHSDEGGKPSWRDRLMTGKRKGSIEKFQSDISKTRQLISLRVELIGLFRSEQNATIIHDFQQRNGAAMTNIMQQLAGLDITVTNLQNLGPSEAMEKALKDQEAALKERFRLCEENRAAAESQVRYKQEFGYTKVGDNTRNLQGLDLDKVKGSVEQKFGNTEIGNSTWSIQGAIGVDMMSKFLHSYPTTSQPQSFRGRGRQLGPNIAILDDIRSRSTPE